MIWIVLPAIATGLCLLWGIWWVAKEYDICFNEWIMAPTFILAILFLLCWIGCPVTYFDGRSTAWRMEEYYDNVITPHVVAETEQSVTVVSLEAGVWQAGASNLVDYNGYLRSNRYWSKNWLGHLFTYPVPDRLKYVKVGVGR